MSRLDSFEQELLAELREVASAGKIRRAHPARVRRVGLPVVGACVAASVASVFVLSGHGGSAAQNSVTRVEPAAFTIRESTGGDLVVTAHQLLTKSDMTTLQSQLRADGAQATVMSLLDASLSAIALRNTDSGADMENMRPHSLWSNCAAPMPSRLATFTAKKGSYTIRIPANSVLRNGTHFYLLATSQSDSSLGVWRVIVPRRGKPALCDGGDMGPHRELRGLLGALVDLSPSTR